MARIYIPLGILLTAVFFIGIEVAPAHAQAPAVQKAFGEVKTKLDDLIAAKDENLADDVALRIQAMKKVVEFSVEEAKTLKVKLLATELAGVDEEALKTWKAGVEKDLSAAGAYYESVLLALTTTTSPLNLAGVKTLAASFKEWRDASFVPVASAVEEFLLIAGQARALSVAETRYAKIASDVAKLERTKLKRVETLSAFLSAARAHLDEASAAYERAHTRFAALITPATSVEKNAEEPEVATTTITAEAEATPPIRDEIRTSLEKIKQAYLVFIEMSAEVKKILK